jgi:large subunit ribosomal protein L28
MNLRRTVMAKRCEVCGKGPLFGKQISHAHNVSNRRWNPNLQRIRVLIGGKVKKMYVCTRCIKSGAVTKAP